MNHRQRIENALAGKETDRLPYSLWMHFPNKDRHPRRLAELTLHYQKKYDFDFIKFMPYGLFSTADYGLDLEIFPGFMSAPVAAAPFIKEISDWDKITRISGVRGEYAVVLEAQRILFEMMDEQVPFITTLFSPMTTALKLCDGETLSKHIAEDPARLRRALEDITATTIQYAEAAVSLGADGFFFASQISCKNMLDHEAHEEFVKKYDKEVLDAVKNKTWFNVLHIHGKDPLIEEMQDYPVHALSWHDRVDGPSMEEVRKYSSKAFVGGLSHSVYCTQKTDEQITEEVRGCNSCNGGRGSILGPGCVIDPGVSESRLELIHKLVRETEGR